MDPSVKVVSLVGRAGSGKTLLAIAAGLQQTIGLRNDENHYSTDTDINTNTEHKHRH